MMMRYAFTLIELLIVILIVSLVYFFGFSDINFTRNSSKTLTPLNLKSSIRNTDLFQGHATLLCTNKCTKCYLRRNLGDRYRLYRSKIDLKESIAYTLEGDDHLEKVAYGRYKDEPICLVIDFYDNGSSTPIVIAQKEKSYFLPSYFGEPKSFGSLDDAKRYWLDKTQLVSGTGEFY